jgi:uncharacterized protein YciI
VGDNAGVARPVALIYAYVEGMSERRAPYRDGHLELIERWRSEGRLRIAGALGDPPGGGLLVFEVEDPAEVEDFVAADPYVEAGLVVERRIEPWTLVANDALSGAAAG